MEMKQRDSIVTQINDTLGHKHRVGQQRNMRVKLTQGTHQMFCEIFEDSAGSPSGLVQDGSKSRWTGSNLRNTGKGKESPAKQKRNRTNLQINPARTAGARSSRRSLDN